MRLLRHAILSLLSVMVPAAAAMATVWEVKPRENVSVLKFAIDAAVENDTVLILPGTYLEHDISITKPLIIKGVDRPTIDAGFKGTIFIVSASGVTITGLRLVNTPASHVKENTAVLLEKIQNCRIVNNEFENNFFAIYAANSSECEIVNNDIVGNAAGVISAGNGIHVWYCKNMTIHENRINAHRDGIYFEFVKYSTVINNHVENNLRYGLHFMFSDSCRYESNKFVKNGAGVAVMYTRHVVMLNNLFKDSWGGAAYGLLLKDIKHCRIAENKFERNSIAIHIEGSDYIQIDKNLLVDNGWAIKIMANSLENGITNNDFVNNSFQVATNSRSSRSTFSQNYWSSYQGYDLDRDGFGDVAYRPVSLYSLLVESNPPTLVLLRSLVIEALDLAERIIPTLTPQTLIDSKPRMKPNL